MTKPDSAPEGQQRPDPADTAPAEGQSRDLPAQDQGKDQGTGQGIDTAYDAPPAEGARDED